MVHILYLQYPELYRVKACTWVENDICNIIVIYIYIRNWIFSLNKMIIYINLLSVINSIYLPFTNLKKFRNWNLVSRTSTQTSSTQTSFTSRYFASINTWFKYLNIVRLFVPHFFVPHFCITLLYHTFVPHFSTTPLYHTFIPHFVVQIIWFQP